MKKLLILVVLYLLSGIALFSLTVFGLVMWAEETMMFY